MSQGSDLIALARSKAGKWYYTNDWWARMNPEESGGTDCSGFARWCYLQFGYNIGTWTGDESKAGREIARGHYAWEIPWDIMQPGDLILMTATYWNNYDFDEYLCHIELYCGGGTMIGHPGGWGPQEKWAQAWMQSYGCITWMVRRVFEEDNMQPVDVWAYTNPSEKIDAYQALMETHRAVTGGGISSWAYRNPSETIDAYKALMDVHAEVEDVKQAIDNLVIGKIDIDYDKLAEVIADKFADRMKD